MCSGSPAGAPPPFTMLDPELQRDLRAYLDEQALIEDVRRQSRLGSAVEALANIGLGYAISVVTQPIIYAYFDLTITTGESMIIGAVFTAISLARHYVLRRLFNSLA